MPQPQAEKPSYPSSRDSSPTPSMHLLFPETQPGGENYDIGNREHLAIKLALEEWRHSLSLVLTDHKNLHYLREAKRLNPRHARWALFFTRFNYTISYRPGPKNTKADALSHLHTPEETEEEPEPIIPKKLIVCPIQWNPDTNTSSNASTATRRAVHQGYSMSPELSPLPASTCTCIPGHPTTPSRCWKNATGGQTWPGMSEGSSKAVLTAPFRKALATYQQASSSLCPFPTGLGHTWG